METDHAQTRVSILEDESKAMPSEETRMEDADKTEKQLPPKAMIITDIAMEPILSFLETITIQYETITAMETMISTVEKSPHR